MTSSPVYYGPEKLSEPKKENSQLSIHSPTAAESKYAFAMVKNQLIAQTSLTMGKIIMVEHPIFFSTDSVVCQKMEFENLDWAILQAFIYLGTTKPPRKNLTFQKMRNCLWQRWNIESGQTHSTIPTIEKQSVTYIKAWNQAIENQAIYDLKCIQREYPLANLDDPIYLTRQKEQVLSEYVLWSSGIRTKSTKMMDWLTGQPFGIGFYEYTSILLSSNQFGPSKQKPNCFITFEGKSGVAYLVCMEPIVKGQIMIGSTFCDNGGIHIPIITWNHHKQYMYYSRDDFIQLPKLSMITHLKHMWLSSSINLSKWFSIFQIFYFQYGWPDPTFIRVKDIIGRLQSIIEKSDALHQLRWKLLLHCLKYENKRDEISRIIQTGDKSWTSDESSVAYQFLTEFADLNPSFFHNEISLWNRLIEPFPATFLHHYFKMMHDLENGFLALYKQLSNLLMSHVPEFVEEHDHPARVERLFE
jgi:hypothetical protein